MQEASLFPTSFYFDHNWQLTRPHTTFHPPQNQNKMVEQDQSADVLQEKSVSPFPVFFQSVSEKAESETD